MKRILCRDFHTFLYVWYLAFFSIFSACFLFLSFFSFVCLFVLGPVGFISLVYSICLKCVTPTFCKNKNFVQIGVHIKL
jgi:hypothetical protein